MSDVSRNSGSHCFRDDCGGGKVWDEKVQTSQKIRDCFSSFLLFFCPPLFG